MDLNPLMSFKIVFFLLGVLPLTASGQICLAPLPVEFPENNIIGAEVVTIVIQPGVSLDFTVNPDDAFGLNTNVLVANKVLDYETLPEGGALTISIRCTKEGETALNINVFVIVLNINDNAPVFAQKQYMLELNELSKVGTSVGRIEATDPDKDLLYYRLISPMDEFMLKSEVDPDILVKKILDYDTTKEVTLNLYVQDTPLSLDMTPSHNDTTTVVVNILDINNRPPWFQPCTESSIGTTKVCVTSGYTGNVNLKEQATGALTLKPGPVYATDGDVGRNDPVRYAIIGGNGNDTFNIDENSGNITMKKPWSTAGPIVLTVMAYELENPDQSATTTVTLQVVISSDHPPQFVKPEYEGFISEDAGVSSMVLESKSGNKPLRVEATDADFADGVNPDITFEAPVGSDFKITPEGFIIMTRAVSPGNVNLQIRVVDQTNDESSTATLSVEVTPGVTTTEMPTTTSKPTTTAMTTTMAISTGITTITATDTTTVTVTQLTESTSSPHTVTTNSETTTTTTTTTSNPHTDRPPSRAGDYKTEDMVALGVSLAVVVLICFVVIGVLAYYIRRFDTDWKKLSEASIFRSSLGGGSGGPKDGVQYTNEGFQADDTDSVTSKQAAELELPRGPELRSSAPAAPETQRSLPTTASADSSSQNASDSTDNEKEVKPILTKERRTEDGYKAVWFKEDIDPNDREEVVIPDRDHDIDHEDDDADADDADDADEDDVEEEEEEEDHNYKL